jgi:hypothetical protein
VLPGTRTAAVALLSRARPAPAHPFQLHVFEGDATCVIASALNDITSGSNVNSPFPPDCGGDYQCNAVPGYDGPTGNGTPDGLRAF